MNDTNGTPAGPRILVVDDEPAVLDAYRRVLDPPTAGTSTAALDELRTRLFLSGGNAALLSRAPIRARSFEVTYCGGAEAAVAEVRAASASHRPYAIVFLDMRMPPGPDGLWAAERIREIDPQVDIVVCTAYSDVDPEDIARRVPRPTACSTCTSRSIRTRSGRWLPRSANAGRRVTGVRPRAATPTVSPACRPAAASSSGSRRLCGQRRRLANEWR